MPSSGQSGAHGVENFPSRWKHSKCRERTAVDYRFAVHEHLELTVVAAEHLDFGLQLAPKPRRHTDGVQPGDSIRAIAHGNATHVFSLPSWHRSAAYANATQSRCFTSRRLSSPHPVTRGLPSGLGRFQDVAVVIDRDPLPRLERGEWVTSGMAGSLTGSSLNGGWGYTGKAATIHRGPRSPVRLPTPA